MADREHAVVARGAHAAGGGWATRSPATPAGAAAAAASGAPAPSSSAKAGPSRVTGSPRPQRRRTTLERLVEQRRASARVALLAEGGQLAPAVAAQAGAEDHAPAGEAVEDGDLARDVPRAPARQRRDHRAQAQALGGQRDGGQRDPRVGDVEPVVGHDVVPDEEAVPAAGLGLARRPRRARGRRPARRRARRRARVARSGGRGGDRPGPAQRRRASCARPPGARRRARRR